MGSRQHATVGLPPPAARMGFLNELDYSADFWPSAADGDARRFKARKRHLIDRVFDGSGRFTPGPGWLSHGRGHDFPRRVRQDSIASEH